MASWAEFEAAVPDFGAIGRHILAEQDTCFVIVRSAVVTLRAILGPTRPIICGPELYIRASARAPAVRDLRATGKYRLDASSASRLDELQICGSAAEISEPAEIEKIASISCVWFKRSDRIFRLSVEWVRWIHWERVEQPDTKIIRRQWGFRTSW